MYREKIRDHYDRLSRSYRRVADYILSNYYDVSFLTAAQLAVVVNVDTTTVVRFSQRIGYNGYPELLNDIREQVRSEIYSAYSAKQAARENRTSHFHTHTEQERQSLSQMLIHNPQEHIDGIVEMIERAAHIVLMAEGYAESIASITAQQLRDIGFSAEAVRSDPILRAGTLIRLDRNMLVIGISATEHGRDVARAMAYARSKNCPTVGIVGTMESPVNRMADRAIYAPTHNKGILPSLTTITAALSGLLAAVSEAHGHAENQAQNFSQAYEFLISAENEIIEAEIADE